MPTNQTPYPEGEDRSKRASKVRKAADKIRKDRPKVITESNSEEDDYAPSYIANFTKGLPHDEYGVVKEKAFEKFRNAINKPDWKFKVTTADKKDYRSTINDPTKGWVTPSFRAWESPLAGHVYDLQGPDAGDVGMAPAPRLDSPELAVEMAEVYAAALLRDVPFSIIEAGGDQLITEDPAGNDKAVADAQKLIDLIKGMDWLDEEQKSSSCDKHEENRRKARLDDSGKFTLDTFLRGSAPGAEDGPFLSQFLLIGNETRNKSHGIDKGYIEYGTQVIDQCVHVHTVGVDFMTDWCSWLDVQNGAKVNEAVDFEPKRRFITTPRDLATYVHYDALYQAYLNACLIMRGLKIPFDKIPFDKGFPEGNGHCTRDAFATFGDPHILSLLTEVATRALKAVRRQKFNHHCRARPEAIGGLLTAYKNMPEAEREGKFGEVGEEAIRRLHRSLPPEMLEYVDEHNGRQNSGDILAERKKKLKCSDPSTIDPNLLLPMAFPEGSPMHPSYGAGHATVAGACVTILKAFFEMYEEDGTERKLPFVPYEPDLAKDGMSLKKWVPSDDGMPLEKVAGEPLTVQGELNKLAANISIGRNMAGVHYYSDYYDSLRMGERIAVGILQEQIITYGEKVSMTFETFDGEVVVLKSKDLEGVLEGVSSEEWWTRHV